MAIRRTTLAADRDDLSVLEGEARRRGVSLAQVLREAVEREANRLRRKARPRFAIGGSGVGAGRASVEDEDAPVRSRWRT